MSILSRLLPEHIEALLAPDALHLRRTGGSESFAVAAAAADEGEGEGEAEAWRAPLAELDLALRKRPARAVAPRMPAALAALLAPRLDIVLSEHFARWQVLPWQADVESAVEREAWARHHFREVYGEAGRHWQVRCAASAPGEAMPACAIDATLLAELQRLAAGHGCRLGRVRPLLAIAAERWRRKLPRGIAWLAVFESGRLSLGLLRDRRWQALHGAPRATPDERGEQLAGLVTRTALAAGLTPGEGRLLLCGEGAASCPAPLPAAAVQRLGSVLGWTAA